MGENSGVQSSSAGLAGDANSIQDGDAFLFDFEDQLVNGDFRLNVKNQGGSDSILFTFYNDGGIVGQDNSYLSTTAETLIASTESQYDSVRVDFFSATGDLKILNAGYEKILLPDGASLDFAVVGEDQDGDQAQQSFSVAISYVFSALAPISLDLDSDGSVSCIPFSSSALALAGWVDSRDGFLVYDYNADGQITESREFVFTMWGQDAGVSTDMQALSEYFDSNGDGLLGVMDDAWHSFGVWQDLNVDGVQQEGELYSLDYWMIDSISLAYDEGSRAYDVNAGDVCVYGQMTITYADGTTGLAEDVSFAVAPSPIEPLPIPAEDLNDLLAQYLDDVDPTLSSEQLASGLDQVVADYLQDNDLPADVSEAVLSEAYAQLASDLGSLSDDDAAASFYGDDGEVDGSAVFAALDGHVDDLLAIYSAPDGGSVLDEDDALPESIFDSDVLLRDHSAADDLAALVDQVLDDPVLEVSILTDDSADLAQLDLSVDASVDDLVMGFLDSNSLSTDQLSELQEQVELSLNPDDALLDDSVLDSGDGFDGFDGLDAAYQIAEDDGSQPDPIDSDATVAYNDDGSPVDACDHALS